MVCTKFHENPSPYFKVTKLTQTHTRLILQLVDPLLGNGPCTCSRGTRHVRGDVTQK
jgi:hypothetical protein